VIDTTSSGEIVSYESGTTVYYPTVLGNSSTPANGTTGGTGSLGNGTSAIYLAAISTNRTSLSYPGREVNFKWDAPGKVTGYNDRYTTNTTAGLPKFAAWVSQLNVTYTPLTSINYTSRTASTIQPNGTVFADDSTTAPVVNGTMFVVLTDLDLYVTPYNLTLINKHVAAGPVLYQAD